MFEDRTDVAAADEDGGKVAIVSQHTETRETGKVTDI